MRPYEKLIGYEVIENGRLISVDQAMKNLQTLEDVEVLGIDFLQAFMLAFGNSVNLESAIGLTLRYYGRNEDLIIGKNINDSVVEITLSGGNVVPPMGYGGPNPPHIFIGLEYGGNDIEFTPPTAKGNEIGNLNFPLLNKGYSAQISVIRKVGYPSPCSYDTRPVVKPATIHTGIRDMQLIEPMLLLYQQIGEFLVSRGEEK